MAMRKHVSRLMHLGSFDECAHLKNSKLCLRHTYEINHTGVENNIT